MIVSLLVSKYNRGHPAQVTLVVNFYSLNAAGLSAETHFSVFAPVTGTKLSFSHSTSKMCIILLLSRDVLILSRSKEKSRHSLA
jgi:hypothetical protein